MSLETLTYMGLPDCIKLSNSTVDVIATAAIGPRWRLKQDMKFWSAIRAIQRPYLRSLGQIGDKQRAVNPKDAALFGDIVVIAIPFFSHLEMPVVTRVNPQRGAQVGVTMPTNAKVPSNR